MSTAIKHVCDGCGRGLLNSPGPLRAHAVKVIAGHGAWGGEHELLADVWQGDLCEECMGALQHFVRYEVGIAVPDEATA